MSYFIRYLLTICAMVVVSVAVWAFLGFPAWLSLAGLIIAWPLVGTLVTIDDDLPGGWSNPDGKAVPEWRMLWWWADLVLLRGALVLCVFVVERAVAHEFSVAPLVAAVVMISIGLPIFLKGAPRQEAHAV